jgi:copper chaperone
VTRTEALCHVNAAGPGVFRTTRAIALLAMLAYSLLPARMRATEEIVMQADETQTKLAITGMTCGHCAESVRRALAGIAGVASAVVELGSGTATVTGKQFEIGALVAAVEAAGYGAKPLDA